MSIDGTSLDRTVRGLYETISGPAGAPRDWDRMEELYAPGARISILHRLETGGAALEQLTVGEYRRSRVPYFAKHAFYEIEVDRETSIRGNLAHVFSAYEGRRTPGGPAIVSGVNTIQLILAEGEWRVLSILWEAHVETPKLSSPGVIPILHAMSQPAE
jgi:hypothetical protein